jgi:capsular exopolysaccharide synthesis family protein
VGKVFKALKRADEAMVVEAEEDRVPDAPIPAPSSPASRKPEPTEPATSPASPVDAAEQMHLGRWDDRLVLATSNTGPVAESIRALRTRILFPSSGKIPRTILVTSASPGEGKSFICANLGISLAQGVDNYCLLVDCDLRKPMQHSLFGQSNVAGLSDYLCHRKPIPDLLLPSGIEKLSLLLSGPRSVNPAELLGSAAMSRLVDELAQRYDDRIVLLDSPPLHAASETSVLAQHVDGVILVVRSGASRREYVKALADAIGRDKILGVVFNAYRATMLDYRVFGYYEYQKDYYYGEK